jgi:hypothetical protein
LSIGALEASAKVVTFNSGASATEILDILSEVPINFDYQMGIASNEKATYGRRSLS